MKTMIRKQQKTCYIDSVLSPARARFFSQLTWTKKTGMYLAGGTALALQIGHRTSVDFDFYRQRHFAKGTLSKLFYSYMAERWQIEITRDIKDNFDLLAKPDIHLSCFYYEYPLVASPIPMQGVLVASLQDIAAMKLIAIAQRGRHRDFVDIYYLLHIFSLDEMIRFGLEKYPMYNHFFFLRGLLYFNDAEEDDDIDRVKLFDRAVTWKKIKKTITEAVRSHQLGM
ncbi:nucleotidyl transferase AbiEii/AbiGii toxin family protein [Candidatus Uhrbacteria bacterium]|nr:nucleotidyl transferase AbiEii/AbiGii toxin family protein [Candidatus Uhrbacteria bacterium]